MTTTTTRTTLFFPTQFIEDALFCTTPLALSYNDPNQKWVIRQHLVSLFQNCPYLKPSLSHFTHDDGAAVKLLRAVGLLPTTPPLPITIWIHELYPLTAPIVYIDNGDVKPNHPFIDPSGKTTSSYLMNWSSSRCNLTDLVHSLIKAFNHSSPFYYSSDDRRHPWLLSRTDAMDRLACDLHRDMHAITAVNEEEIRRLAAIQVRLQDRAGEAAAVIGGLDEERRWLEERVNEVCGASDRVLNWLEVYDDGNIDEVFEGVDWASRAELECRAEDMAVEDLMYALDKGVESGVLGFGEYMKQVRLLAREQFLWRAKIVRIQTGFVQLLIGV